MAAPRVTAVPRVMAAPRAMAAPRVMAGLGPATLDFAVFRMESRGYPGIGMTDGPNPRAGMNAS
jgi:hypothetical protein